MKKIVVLILSLIIFNCSPSKPIKTEKKETSISGKWLVESITDNNETILTQDAPLLNDVSFLCFNQSIWKFNPANNSGEYHINDLYCKFGKRLFSLNAKQKNTQGVSYDFTLTPNQKKGKKINSKPYKFKLIAVSETTMQWQQSVMLNNKMTTININFKKLKKADITDINSD